MSRNTAKFALLLTFIVAGFALSAWLYVVAVM
jgi:hypothetical protein